MNAGAERRRYDASVMKLLLVEDELPLSEFLTLGLMDEGFVVEAVTSGTAAAEIVRSASFDLILLDVMLPGLDGFSLCEEWRRQGLGTPILFLTARDGVAQRVRGLSLGGDDYLVKPFAFTELVARIRAILRRAGAGRSIVSLEGGAIVDMGRQRIIKDDAEAFLTMREWQILECLLHQRGRITPRLQLWESVWEAGATPDSNIVDVYVRRLREKLGAEAVETVRGAGYRLRIQTP